MKYHYLDTNILVAINAKNNITIAENKYIGLASFKAKCINELNQKFEIKAELKATPLDKLKQIVTSKVIFKNDKGTPYHSDLIYSETTIQGEPNTQMRQYAKELVKKTTTYIDPTPDKEKWTGKTIN